jgi:hypothetical protein
MPISWVRPLLVCTMLAAAAACSESSSPTAPTPGGPPQAPVALHMTQGQSTRVPGTGLQLTLEHVYLPREVVFDCVANTPCRFGPLADIVMNVPSAGERRTSLYQFFPAGGDRHSFGGYTVRLTRLNPDWNPALAQRGSEFSVDFEITRE